MASLDPTGMASWPAVRVRVGLSDHRSAGDLRPELRALGTVDGWLATARRRLAARSHGADVSGTPVTDVQLPQRAPSAARCRVAVVVLAAGPEAGLVLPRRMG